MPRKAFDPTKPRAIVLSVHEAKLLRDALGALEMSKDQPWKDYWHDNLIKLRAKLLAVIHAMGGE